MNNKNLTDRVLLTGAILSSLAGLGGVALFTYEIVDCLRNWRFWAHLEDINQWFQIPFCLLFLVIIIGVVVRIWQRLFDRRRILTRLERSSFNSAALRSKYAFWSLERRLMGRHRASRVLRVRKKKIRH